MRTAVIIDPLVQRLFLVLTLCLGWPMTAQAQLQVVFGLDDSASMGRGSGGSGTDPDRLSRFATGALISALDDTVEAAILSMSEREGQRSGPSLAPLAINRERLEQLVRAPVNASERGTFWNQDGRDTPCQRLLNGIQQTFNAAYRPDATQVAIFLSDGVCTDTLDVSGFLRGLRSEQRAGQGGAGPRPFQFYLVCLGHEQSCSPQLTELARATGGQAYSVTSSAPRDLVQVFGTALGRSQGVCPTVHNATDNRLLSHPGATSVRLLGFSREGGTGTIRFANGAGAEMRTERSVMHYSDQRLFRYVAGTMSPNQETVVLNVEGQGAEGWAIVAVPDYRLRPTLRVLNHDCDQSDATELGGTASGGQTLCVELRVTGEGDQLVRRDGVGTGMSATLTIDAPPEAALTGNYPMNAASDGRASFRFSLPRVANGVYQLAASVTVDMDCTSGMGVDRPEPLTIQSDRRSVTVSTLMASFDTDEVDFGALGLGASADQRITPGGNFVRTEMDFTVGNAEQLPSCVRLSLNGLPPGSRHWVAPGQAMQIQATVDPFCDWVAAEQALQTTATLTDPSGGVPPLLQTVRLTLRPQIGVPQPGGHAVSAGDSGVVEIPFEWVTERESIVMAELLDLPRDNGLTWRLLPEAVPVPSPPALDLPPGAVLYRVPARAGGAAESIRVRLEARSNACCRDGVYEATIALSPLIDGLPGAQQTVPVRVEVSDYSWWVCNGSRVLWFLLFLLASWVLGFVVSFFSRRRLVPRGIVIAAKAWRIRDYTPTGESDGGPAELSVGEPKDHGEWVRLPNKGQRFAARWANMNLDWPLGWPGLWLETLELGRVGVGHLGATFMVSDTSGRRVRHVRDVKDGADAGHLEVGTLVVQAQQSGGFVVFVVVHSYRAEGGGDVLRRWGTKLVDDGRIPDPPGDSAEPPVFRRLNGELAIRFAESISNYEKSEPYGVLLTLLQSGR